MATQYNTPGVYAEIGSTLPVSITSAATCVPVFIGHTVNHDAHAALVDGATFTAPYQVSTLKEYEDIFGKGPAHDFSIVVADSYGNAPDYEFLGRSVTVTPSTTFVYTMYYHIVMYFANGGGPCYIVSLGTAQGGYGAMVSDFTDVLDELEKEADLTLLVFPDATALSTADYGSLMDAARTHAAKMGNRFVLMDVPASSLAGVDTDFRNLINMEDLSYGAAYFPALETKLGYVIDETALTVSHTATDPVPAPVPGKAYMNGDPLSGLPSFTDSGTDYVELALYNEILAAIADYSVTLHPCGAVAGLYYATDASRGVWKAPANVELQEVITPTVLLTNAEQDGLNVNTASGKSVNAIRAFVGRGTVVWGARTLAGNSAEWRYVPVRRLFLAIEYAVKQSLAPMVFEANNATTWIRIKQLLQNYLTGFWRKGALAGASTAEAFYVRAGLNETMTSTDVLEGRLIVEIGLAAARPAEFIVIRFEQQLVS